MKKILIILVAVLTLVFGTATTGNPQTTIENYRIDDDRVIIWNELSFLGPVEGTGKVEHGAQSDPGDGKLTIPTEIVAMNLSTVDATAITVTESPAMNSTGEIKQITPGIDFPAESFFDVYVEVELGGETLHNKVPIRLQSQINSIPFYGAVFQQELPGPIPLFNEADEEAGSIEFDGLTFDKIPPTGANMYLRTGAGLLALITGMTLVVLRRRRGRSIL